MRGSYGGDVKIAENLTTGNSDWVQFSGGQGTMCVYGTLDGASVQIGYAINQSFPMSTEVNGLFTSGAARDFRSAQGFLRVETAGGGASQDITVVLRPYSDA